VTLNCAALPENLVESELFGHEKGAFTGAYKQKIGKFEYANGATLFLDEIGDMSLSTQSKLLRVLQDKTVQRIGGHNCIEADVRIIVATHKDLNELIKTGCFREDLFYRINVVQIHVPPLRERKEDIPSLADYFIKKFNTFYKTAISPLTEDELRKLMRYDFPGNVRELKNIIERAVILAHDGHLSLDFLPQLSNHTQPKLSHPSNITLENLEKDYIKTVLEQAQYNKTKAARILGIARKTLREKMAKYQIQIKSDD
jgi:transcriptional regulator with PAS, ATPase and Fis domain